MRKNRKNEVWAMEKEGLEIITAIEDISESKKL
jgi:hypothetical protein